MICESDSLRIYGFEFKLGFFWQPACCEYFLCEVEFLDVKSGAYQIVNWLLNHRVLIIEFQYTFWILIWKINLKT